MARAAAGLADLEYDALGPVGDYLLACQERGFAARTVWEKYAVLQALGDVAGHPLHAAPEPAVRNWWRGLTARGLKDSTKACYLSHARMFFRWVVREGHRADDPTVRIDPPRRRAGLPKDVDPTAALAAVAVVERSARLDGRAWLAVVLGLHLGMRCVEICAVHPARDLRRRARGEVLRVEGKGGRERVIPVTPAVSRAMKDLAAGGYLFPSLRSGTGHWSPAHTSAVIAESLRGAGLDATAHPLRHTAATALLDACGDITQVKEFLGHASLTSTQIYARAVGPSREVVETMYAHAEPRAS